ncbi:MAG: hypothetical protein WCJ39_01115 [bacterium]
MHKQEEKNKVYHKMHKRGKKVENLAETLNNIKKNRAIDDKKEKSKLLIKTIKEADLDFETKQQTKSEISEKTKNELREEFQKKMGEPKPPIVTE